MIKLTQFTDTQEIVNINDSNSFKQIEINVYALDAPHEARSMRSSGVAPVKDHPSSNKLDFAFTAPLGFERPKTPRNFTFKALPKQYHLRKAISL
jgi:hypothetical protein